MNECLNQSVCGRGRCVNTEGSYRCNCFQGYKLSPDNVCQGICQSEDRSDIIHTPCQSYFSVSSSPQGSRGSLAVLLKVYLKKEIYKELEVGFIFFFPPMISLQMWMSVCFRESVSTADASIWTEPTDAPVTMATKSPQTANHVKVCKGLSRAVGCNSSPHTFLLVAHSRQQLNGCKLFPC